MSPFRVYQTSFAQILNSLLQYQNRPICTYFIFAVKKILVMKFSRLFAAFSAAVLSVSCMTQADPDSEFVLYYQGVRNIHPGESISLTPSYIGDAPSDFRIYSISLNGALYYAPKLDGELGPESSFWVDPATGAFKIQKTSSFNVGEYVVSISCVSGGKTYEYPSAIVATFVKETL